MTKDKKIFRIAIVALLIISLVIRPEYIFAYGRIKYRKVKLKVSPIYNDFVRVLGYFKGEDLNVKFFSEKTNYVLKIYFLGVEKDTLFPSRNLCPKIFYTSFNNLNFIDTFIRERRSPVDLKLKKYKLVMDFYYDSKLFSRYTSIKELKL